MSLRLILSALVFVSIVIDVKSQLTFYEQYTVKNGLPSNTIYMMFQDSKRYLWLGTDAGVSRFDGDKFQNFTTENGLSDNEVFRILEDKKGRIWFATFNGKPSYFYKDSFYNGVNDTLLGSINVKSICTFLYEDLKGNIWMSYENGIVIKIGFDNKVVIFKNFISSEHRFSIVFFESLENKLIVLVNSKLYEFDHGKSNFIFIRNENDLSIKNYPAKINKDSVLICTNAGFSLVTKSATTVLFEDRLGKLFNEKVHNLHTFLDSDSRFWITTNSNYIYTFKKNGNKWLLENEINTTYNVRDIYQDVEGNIWLATHGFGILQLPYDFVNVKSYNKTNGLNEDQAFSIKVFNDSTFFVGLNNSIVQKIAPGKINSVKLIDNSYNRCLDMMWFDRQLVVATDFGLYTIHPENLSKQRIIYKKNNEENMISSLKNLAIGSNGELYFSFFTGYGKINARNFLKNEIDTCIYLERVFHVFPDSIQNSIWLSTVEGIGVIIDNKFNNLSKSDPRFSYRIKCSYKYNNDLLFLGTDGYGVLVIKNNRIIEVLNTKNGLPSNVINKIRGKGEDLYFATGEGLAIAEIDNEGEICDLKNFSYFSGMGLARINDIDLLDDRIFLATSAGVLQFERNDLRVQHVDPILSFNLFTADQISYKIDSVIKVKAGASFIQIVLGAPYFSPGKEVVYRYRMNEANASWQELKSPVLSFYNLKPSAYNLTVEAGVKDLFSKQINWSQPTKLRFEILPFFHQTWFFKALLVLAGVFLLYQIFKAILNFRYQKNMRKEKERLMIQNERNRIARDIHDDLGSELSSIILMSQVATTPNINESKLKKTLSSMQSSASDVSKKMDEIIWALGESNDTVNGLFSYVKEFLYQFSETTNINVVQEIELLKQDIALNSLARRNLFLIIKEFMNNVNKHSKSDEVHIYLMLMQDNIKLIMKDFGVGFDPSMPSNPHGNGLKNFAKRALEISARYEFYSEPGEGARLELIMPIVK